MILVTPFDSREAVARDLFWSAPVGSLLRNRMPTIEVVCGSNVPTALITARRDTIVPDRCNVRLRMAIKNSVFSSIDGISISMTIPISRRRRGRRLGRGDTGRDVLTLMDRISRSCSSASLTAAINPSSAVSCTVRLRQDRPLRKRTANASNRPSARVPVDARTGGERQKAGVGATDRMRSERPFR